MAILVLGSPEIVAAFALGGMRGRAVRSREDLRSILEEVKDERMVRVLIIEERLAEEERETVDRIKLDPDAPLLVEVAGLEGPMENRATPLDLMRRALGITF